MKLLHKCGRRVEWKNFRPIAIISVMCKLCTRMVGERINEWADDSGLLSEVQCDSEEGGVHKITCLCQRG